MEATDMTFNDNHFDNITSFYTLMFMSEKTQQQAICEAVRVLKPNGEFHIWDCNIDSAYPVPFVTEMEIALPDRNIKTTYGVGKMDTQSINSIKLMCKTVGLTIECIKEYDSHFYIKCRKV